MASNIISYEHYDQLPKRVRESIALELTEADKMFVDKSLGILISAGQINQPLAQQFNTAEETQYRLDAGCAIVTLLAMICDFNHIAYDGIMYYEWDEWGYGLGLDYEDLRQRCVQLGSDCPDEPWDQRWCYGNLLRELSELTYEEVYQALAAGFGGKVNLFAALGRIVADYNGLDFDEEVDLDHLAQHWSLAGTMAESESECDALAAVMSWVSSGCSPWYDRSEWSNCDSEELGLTDE